MVIKSLPSIRVYVFVMLILRFSKSISPLEMAERLGNEKIETTLNTYSHLYPNKQAQLADRLDGEFEIEEEEEL